MTDSAAMIAHRLCGSPRVDGCVEHDGVCWHCGASMSRGARVADWMGQNFTGQDRVLGGAPHTHVCEPCIFVMSRKSEVPGHGAREGQACGPNWRNFSTFADARGLVIVSKGDKPAMRAWLRAPKVGAWFAAIGESGQKHVIPYAPVNPSGAARGRVQFEEDVVALPGADGWLALDEAAALLTSGATKDSILSGTYTPGEYGRCAAAIRAFEGAHARLRGSPWFRLLVWLAQRDEGAVAERMEHEKAARAAKEVKRGKSRRVVDGVVAGRDGDGDARPSGGVPRERSEPVEALGPTPRPDASGDEDVGERRGVADVDVPRLATRRAEQCSIFGDR